MHVVEAIESKIANDAGSRNALNKLHLALSKAMGEAGKFKKNTDETLVSMSEDGLPEMEEQGREGSVLANDEDKGMGDTKDTLLDELLSDEEY